MAAGAKVKPLPRFLEMLRPDYGDAVSVVIFSFVTGVLALATPLAVEALVNTVAFGSYLQPLFVLATILFTFLIFAAALRVLIALVAEIVQRRFFVRLAVDLGERLPRLDAAGLEGKYGPELVNRFMDVVTVQKVVSMILLDGIALVISTVTGMLLLAFYHPFLLGFDVLLLLLMMIIIFGLGRGAIGTARDESVAKYKMVAWLQELVRNPTAFCFHGGQSFAAQRVDELASEYLDYRRKHFAVLLRQIVTALMLYAIASVALLSLGGYLVISGQLTLGQLVAAELVVTVIVGAFAKLGKQMESFYDLMAAVDKIGVLLDLPLETSGSDVLPWVEGPKRVEIRDASFTCDGGTILDRINHVAEAGQAIALVGPTASGKSLLLRSVVGRQRLTSGFVTLDGTDLRELDRDVTSEHIGYAVHPEIFAGTIKENILLGRKRISGTDLGWALAMVGLLDVMRHMPDGLDTQLATSTELLSRGQKDRLMIARAIASRPGVLVIDSLLDRLPGAEARIILASLIAQPRPWTLLLATNRSELAAMLDDRWEFSTTTAMEERGGIDE